MTMTNPPPVAPVEGHYALLRNGEAVGPINKYAKQPYLFTARLPHMSWRADGVSDWDDSDYDIIATISPADMQAVANGELERLRAENKKLRMDRGFAIGWITALANNPYKPMTWMQTREAAADCLAALQGDAP